MLDPGDAQALHARTVDRALPRSKFFERQAVAFEHFVDGAFAGFTGEEVNAMYPDVAGLHGESWQRMVSFLNDIF